MDSIEIQSLLHQREPYLMVDKVLEFGQKHIKVEKNHTGEEAHVKGHFPGAPVVPGAMLQEICTQGAGILLTKNYSPVLNYNSEKTKGHAIGVLNKVEYAKFLSIVKPERKISATIELLENNKNLFKFKAKVFQDGNLMAKFKFNLMNISDEYLY